MVTLVASRSAFTSPGGATRLASDHAGERHRSLCSCLISHIAFQVCSGDRPEPGGAIRTARSKITGSSELRGTLCWNRPGWVEPLRS